MSKAVAYERALGRLRALEFSLSANTQWAAAQRDSGLRAVFEVAALEAAWLVKVFESYGPDIEAAGAMPTFREELASVLIAHKALKAEAEGLARRVGRLEAGRDPVTGAFLETP